MMTTQRLTAFLLLIVPGVTLAAEPRPADFGKQWVRSHPFTITALIQRKEAVQDRMYADAGLNTMLVWKDRPELYQWAKQQGLPYHYHVNKRQEKLTDELKVALESQLRAHPGCEGVIVCDEPQLTDMPAAGEIMDWVKQAHPHLLVYSNAYPMVWTSDSMAKLSGGQWLASGIYDEPPAPYSYDEYLRDFIHIMKPDVLMMDQYPFVQPPEGDAGEYYQERYFVNLAAVRKAALGANIPFWLFIQAYEGASGSRRQPSESDLRMQVFSSLAHGCTGIGYFTYDAVENGAMLDDDLNPTRVYHNVAKLNKEVANIGNALRFLTSTDVRYIPSQPPTLHVGRVAGVPSGIGLFHPMSRVASEVQEIAIDQPSDDRNAMIGLFSDDDGGKYFMLVNLTHGGDWPAEQAAISIRLKLAPAVISLTRLSRESGRAEPLEVFDGVVELTLPGGSGDLFKVGDGRFPGIPQN